MPRKAIAFLGVGPYRETTYIWQDRQYTTPFMPEATARMFAPDELLIVLTPDAEQQGWDELYTRLEGVVPVTPLRITGTHSEDALWQIFGAIADAIKPGDTIIFDITNGFRSIPVLALLAASFLRTVHQTVVERMIYGAFDARKDDRTPIFDLTPFIALLDWTTATDAFLRYGRADRLTDLVRHTALPTLGSATDLGGLADRLQQLTQALQTALPIEVMQTADGLEHQIAAVQTHTIPSAQPFTLLLDRIGQEYARFGLAQPRRRSVFAASLQRQRIMIDWYLAKGLAVQAISLAREWLVSFVIAQAGGNMYDRQHRSDAEALLNGYASSINSSQVPQLRDAHAVWKDIRRLRNNVAHMGMQGQAPAAAMLIADTRELCARLPVLSSQ
jgi:CRISPR-associated DxTHG motif protein